MKQFKFFQSQIDAITNQINSQISISSINNSIDITLKYENAFNSGLILQCRKKVGEFIIKHINDKNVIVLNKENYTDDIEDIYDFFDTIGYFIKRNYVKPEDVWHHFDFWYRPYYKLLNEKKIKFLAGFENSKTIWNNLEELMCKFNEMERNDSGDSVIDILTEEELIIFFDKESKLFIKENN